MNNNDKENWNDYMARRGVSQKKYDQYKIPAYVLPYLPVDKDRKIVDLGCGLGQFIIAAKRAGYENCLGIEPSADACSSVTARGGSVFCGTVAQYGELRLRDAKLVVMSHVLEHIPKERIIETLALIKSAILAPDGVLLVAVPNASSATGCYWRYEDWTHTCIFTAGSLLYVLRAAGFKTVTIVDPMCLAETRPLIRPTKRALLFFYVLGLRFVWRLTSTSLHTESPLVLSFEVKAVASGDL